MPISTDHLISVGVHDAGIIRIAQKIANLIEATGNIIDQKKKLEFITTSGSVTYSRYLVDGVCPCYLEARGMSDGCTLAVSINRYMSVMKKRSDRNYIIEVWETDNVLNDYQSLADRSQILLDEWEFMDRGLFDYSKPVNLLLAN